MQTKARTLMCSTKYIQALLVIIIYLIALALLYVISPLELAMQFSSEM